LNLTYLPDPNDLGLIAMIDPSNLGLTWLQGPGAWVMPDPDIKLKKRKNIQFEWEDLI